MQRVQLCRLAGSGLSRGRGADRPGRRGRRFSAGPDLFHLHAAEQGDRLAHSSTKIGGKAGLDQATGPKTIWVWIVIESSRPDSSTTRVCQTIVRLPRCSGVASARTRPARAAAKKLVLDSTGVVPAPGGRFRMSAAG